MKTFLIQQVVFAIALGHMLVVEMYRWSRLEPGGAFDPIKFGDLNLPTPRVSTAALTPQQRG